jgi:hypothetical protein
LAEPDLLEWVYIVLDYYGTLLVGLAKTEYIRRELGQVMGVHLYTLV